MKVVHIKKEEEISVTVSHTHTHTQEDRQDINMHSSTDTHTKQYNRLNTALFFFSQTNIFMETIPYKQTQNT